MVRAGLARFVIKSARGLGLRRRSRVAPGPLRVVHRRSGPSVASGALFGGLLAFAVLAALSLPLVFSRGAAPDAQVEAEIAYVGAASDEAPQPAQSAALEPSRIESPRIEPARIDASTQVQPAQILPARAQSASVEPSARAGGHGALALELPVLQDAAAEIEAEAPPVALPVPPKPATRKAAARKPATAATNVARAATP